MKMSFAPLVLVAALTASAALNGAYAADSKQRLTAAVQKPLQDAKKALDANDPVKAAAALDEAKAVTGRTPFDDYTIHQFEASVAIKKNDLKSAETAVIAALTFPDIDPAEKLNLEKELTEVAVNIQDWPTVAQYGEMVQAAGPLEPSFMTILAIGYFNTGKMDKAVQLAKTQIDAAKAAGKEPDKAMLQIVMNAQAKSNDMGGVVDTLSGLVQQDGNPHDWGQLIGLSFAKGMSEAQALHLYRLRIVTGAETAADDYAIMADISLKSGYPAETVAIIEHGQASGVLKPGDKGSALLGAARAKVPGDEKSLPAFEAQAKARKTGDYDIKVAETYYGYGRYADAEQAAQRAISKGGLKDPGEGPLVLGEALVGEHKDAEAAAAFAKVTGDINQKVAHLWTLYAQRKYGVAPAAK